MLGCKPLETPVEVNARIGKEEGETVDRGRYQRLVGKLIYFSHTRPNIAFAVSMVSQYMHSLFQKQMDAMYRILHYLKSSPRKGIYFKKLRNDVLKLTLMQTGLIHRR